MTVEIHYDRFLYAPVPVVDGHSDLQRPPSVRFRQRNLVHSIVRQPELGPLLHVRPEYGPSSSEDSAPVAASSRLLTGHREELSLERKDAHEAVLVGGPGHRVDFLRSWQHAGGGQFEFYAGSDSRPCLVDVVFTHESAWQIDPLQKTGLLDRFRPLRLGANYLL